MSLPNLYTLAQHFALSPSQAQALAACAHTPPHADWPHRLWRNLAVVAALLLGCGLIFWIAAQWPEQTRSFKLQVLQASVLAPLVVAMWRPSLRTAGLLLATLALGALLAFIGQTYQTGADAWQLFAVWAVLALPWTVVAAKDGLWALWLVIAATGLGFWCSVQLNLFGIFSPGLAGLWPQLLLWLPLWLLPGGLPHLKVCAIAQPRISRAVGAGVALGAWAGFGVMSVLQRDADWAVFGLASVLVAAVVAAAWRKRNILVLGLGLMAANALWLVAAGHYLFSTLDWAGTGAFSLMTLVIAASVGASAHGLYRLQKEGAV